MNSPWDRNKKPVRGFRYHCRLIINSRTHVRMRSSILPSLNHKIIQYNAGSFRTVKHCHTHSLGSRVELLPGRERQVSHGDVELLSLRSVRHGTAPVTSSSSSSSMARQGGPPANSGVAHHRHPVEDEWRDSFHSRQPERLVIYSYFRRRFFLFNGLRWWFAKKIGTYVYWIVFLENGQI